MNCPKCGASIGPGSAFCPACGAGVTDPGAATVMVVTAEQQDQLLVQLKHELAKDYAVEKELGRGGMAVVYRAREIELRRLVALKVLPPGMGSGEMAERFRREARMAAALDHPNIIPIYRVGQAAGTYYFAMKFVEGRAVDAIVERQGALPIAVVLQILRAAASALAFAHERQIVHRDIKGANIMVDRDGRVLVADFGIARASEEKTLTASGSIIGTPHFMSPEQCSGQKVGPQSDQYSLGVLAFQMLTGQVPFDADSMIAIIQHHYFTPVPDIRTVREGVPEELLAIVARTLAKDPAQRYATTHEMVKALDAVPCPADEEARAEDLLRELAKGEPIPKVRTGSLPPLADARTLAAVATAIQAGVRPDAGTLPSARTVTAPGTARPRPRPAKRSRAPVFIAAAAVVVVAGVAAAWLTLGRRASLSPAPGSSATGQSVTVVPGRPAAPQAAAPLLAQPDTSRAATPPAAKSATGPTRRSTATRAAPAPGAPRTQAPIAPQAQPAAPAGSGLIRVRTVPPNAQIFVDGRKIGDGSAVDVELPAGLRRLRITAPGYVTFDTTINVEPGGTVRLRTITLRSEGAP